MTQFDSADVVAEIADYLSSIPAWYLATEADGQPHVRPFSFAEAEADELWFCTANTKDVFDELADNPRFEACAWKPGTGWLILRGSATFGEPSPELRKHGYEHLCSLGESYESSDDARLAFFKLTDGAVWRCDIDGSRQEIYANR